MQVQLLRMGFLPAIGTICQYEGRAKSGSTATSPLDLARIQKSLKHQHLVALSRSQQEGHWPSCTITLQVDFRAKSTL